MLNLTRFNQSLVSVLQKRAEYSPHLPAFTCLENGADISDTLTCGELDNKARLIAGFLQSRKWAGQRVLLIYPAGCDFIAAFMGCLYAGVTAVPVAAPGLDNAEKHLALIKTIADDAEISGVLCASHFFESLHSLFKREIKSRRIFLQDTTCIVSNAIYELPILNDKTICYLQYTSGSTSAPKAAIITQQNLTASLTNTLKVWKYNDKSITLAWAPHTHVYGLICGLLMPLYHGTQCIIIPPQIVVQNPLLWLQAMTNFKVTHSGCPNFGYELCIQHIDEEAIKSLHLSHWKVAVNGGDKVQAATLKRFAARFKSAKFHEKSFNSAYGMSEVTGAIAVTSPMTRMITTTVTHQTQTLEIVSSGNVLPGLTVKVVDPELGKEVEPGKIGEVWLKGKAVARGYWNRVEESKTIFEATLNGCESTYFRTGDLGFMSGKQLFLTGRLKDLIIIHGKKYYPQEIENKVSRQFTTEYDLGLSICFTIPTEKLEEVIFIQEVESVGNADLMHLQQNIKKFIASEYGIHCDQIIVTSKNSIARTHSGKIQRKKCEELFKNNLIKPLEFSPSQEKITNTSPIQQNELLKAMQRLMAETLGLEAESIHPEKLISDYGFDSIKLIRLSAAVNKQLGLTLTPADLFGFETIADFYAFIGSASNALPLEVVSVEPVREAMSMQDIAIIGMDGRFPNADTLQDFWDNLVSGKDGIAAIPEARWDGEAYYGDPFSENKTNSKWGGFINHMYAFDADFFHISPHEAALMDPQHRIFLQTVWHCVEHAGYALKTIAEQRVGLFVGIFNHDYAEILNQHQLIDAYSTTGIAPSLLANRISYLLNFSGPSEIIDTACSSSLVAIHRAVQAIQCGDCEIAIAGGVNALLTPTSFISASKAGMLSPDGHCKTFDESANGFVRSEGVGAILLKPLHKALADNDTIWGVIKGSAVNHGGHANSLTAPNPSAQADVIMQAYRRSNVPVSAIQFIETHGTGTQLGDPVEVNGLKLAFETLAKEQQITLKNGNCGLASLKSHIGHLESAAGIASVIKILLAMKHQKMPKNLHFNSLNPYISVAESPFYLVNEVTPWQKFDLQAQQFAGVSSFGFGGANSHILLASDNHRLPSMTDDTGIQILALSAKSEYALKQKVKDLHDWIHHEQDVVLPQLAYTLNVCRDHFEKRLVLCVSTAKHFKKCLNALLQADTPLDKYENTSDIQSDHVGLLEQVKSYLSGEKIDWKAFYQGRFYQAIVLPGYPFAKTEFGVSYLSDKSVEQTKMYDLNDYLMAEHRIHHRALLPGAALLELMVNSLAADKPVVMNHIKWMNPFEGGSLQLSVKKQLSDIECKITADGVVISTATALRHPLVQQIDLVNMNDIKNNLPKTLGKKQFYQAFKQKQCEYGKSFQVLDTVYFSESRALAKLSLQSNDDVHLYQYHPVLIDGILHSAFALFADQSETYIPVSVGQAIFHETLPNTIWVQIVKNNQDFLDITALNESGKTLIEFKNVQLAILPTHSNDRIHYIEPQWVKMQDINSSNVALTSLMIIEKDHICSGIVKKKFPDVTIDRPLNPGNLTKELIPSKMLFYFDVNQNSLEACFKPVFETCKKLLSLGLEKTVKMVVATQSSSIFCDALSAFFKSIALENPKLQGSVVSLANLDDLPMYLSTLECDAKIDEKGDIYCKEYAICSEDTTLSSNHFKQYGKYLFTGGMGEISKILCTYLAGQFQPTLILLGRSSANQEVFAQLKHLKSLGANAIYYSVDLTNHKNLADILKKIEKKIGQLDGVVHAAGITHDAFLIHKTWEQVSRILAPKVIGLMNLDKLTQHHALDFFVTCSSAASVLGNAGQSDYAYANAFMDHYVSSQNISLKTKRYTSINWPHWQEGGFALSDINAADIFATTGLKSLSSQDGINAFLHVLSMQKAQVAVFPGDIHKLLSYLNENNRAVTIRERHQPTVELRVLLYQFLIKLVSEATQLSVDKIKLEESFETFGIDSVMVIGLNQKLSQHFDKLPKTIFYEYANLKSLAEYFLKDHTSSVMRLFDVQIDSVIEQLPIATQQTPNVNNTIQHDDIAIIGLSGRYPGADTLTEFWDNLLSGKDCISELPDRRKQFANSTGRSAGFLSDIDLFDANFFSIAPRDAERMDPQERLFLETAWSAIEDAAYTRDDLSGKNIGVYVGVMYGHYELYGDMANSVFSSIPNRVSYYFNLTGPSMALDTMCSSSLTSLHLACQSLKSGETEMALVGGVNLSLHAHKFHLLEQGGFLSTNDRCMSFGEGGDGYVPGEGVGAVLLKPLAQALLDNDHVYGVIKASALNHGGKTNGFTVPNPQSQHNVIQKAYQSAGINPDSISYIEAHGTGTSLGDPIEIEGLTKFFKTSTREAACAIGSVKSNIGHCESAAGMAALTKVLLQMQYQQLVPSLHAELINSNIDWEAAPFQVQKTVSPWNIKTTPRRAGISSFGAGGSNAHVVIEEALNVSNHSQQRPYYLFTVSAKQSESLSQQIAQLRDWLLLTDENVSLADISFTLNRGRNHFDLRCAIVAKNKTQLTEILSTLVEGRHSSHAAVQSELIVNRPSKMISDKVYQPILHALNDTSCSDVDYHELLTMFMNWYVDGYELPWRDLYTNHSYHKLSMPTYVFHKQSYWVGRAVTTEVVSVNAGSLSIEEILKNSVISLLKLPNANFSSKVPLVDLGFESLTFKEFAADISRLFSIDVSPTLFYTYSTLYDLAIFLNKQSVTAKQDVLPILPVQEDIAIIGMHGYFPQSDNVTEFWQHLIAGDDLVTEVPADRWDVDQYYSSSKLDKTKSVSKWGGFLKSVKMFDAEFFNLSAREVNLMDPQQRLFLEVVWKTLEDAGKNPADLAKQKVGVFVGAEFNEYQTLIMQTQADYHGSIATGNSHSMLPNRVSYFFDFKGPSEAIDTACSSSLVAIHRAVQSIRLGECSYAIAGGVSLLLNPDTLTITSQLGALSTEGRCKTFDASANGYVKGEGVAALLLKPLSAAIRDNDSVYGVIKGSAVNHGGKAQSLTAPNALAQTELLMTAYQHANIDPRTVSYIEVHGTGTELGDPIEIDALKSAFNQLIPQAFSKPFCALGALKSQIGHLEPASGVAGVMKVLLAMRHHMIPANLHCQKLNPYIDLTNSPFYLVNEATRWDRANDLPRRAGVSSFGFGGSNAHLILEECLSTSVKQSTPSQQVICLSAKKQSALIVKVNELMVFLNHNISSFTLQDLAYTLNVGRAHFEYRCVFVVNTLAELQDQLLKYSNNLFMKNSDTTHPIAEKYLQGQSVDWNLYYDGMQCKKIHLLPAYPFDKKPYWFVQPNQDKLVGSVKKQDVILSEKEQVIALLAAIFSDVLQIPANDIEAHQTYEVYGVDSVMGLDITQRLEKIVGEVSKTLLYERNTLNDLSQYLLKNHKNALSSLLGSDLDVPAVLSAPTTIQNSHHPHIDSQDIAIIGLTGTYPCSATVDELWENLVMGKDCVEEVPRDRWHFEDYSVKVGGKDKTFNQGGFIQDIDKFDPLFFGIAPNDAALMDPQERLFLQSGWSTLEDAGYTRDKLQQYVDSKVGVFVGVTYNFYPLFIAEEWAKGNRIPLDIQLFSVANRLSYFLNAKGPSLVIDTACSSSLAALHQACESIQRGECIMALAGGVNLSLHPSKYHMLGSMSFLADDGRCRSFGEGGTGYVPAEAVGSVLLKPLALAEKHGDRILGVIKASTINHGGKTSGYTVPNPVAQAQLIQDALRKAAIPARSVSYIEAHGTGTALGDPIEIRGLQEAFEQETDDLQFCAIGSIKSNIGHAESAAGISQLTKVLLQLQHQKIVGSLHSSKLNPFIDFNKTAFYVPQMTQDWQAQNNMPRRAGISSFGAGGTNVHVILEEYVKPTESGYQAHPFVFVLSAVNEERLMAYIDKMSAYCVKQKESYSNPESQKCWLQQLCYTLQVGREAMAWRVAFVAETPEAFFDKLQSIHARIETVKDGVWKPNSVKIQHKLTATSGLSLAQDKEQIISLWMDGCSIAWETFYVEAKPSLLSLPTYPYARRHCWVASQPASDEVKASTPKDAVSTLESTHSKPTWLIFSDHEVGTHIIDQVGRDNCIVVYPGEGYRQYSESVYYINPQQLADYQTVFSKAHAVEHIVYLCGGLTTVREDRHKQFLLVFQALTSASFKQSLLFSYLNQEKEQDDVLLHHLWNLQSFFADATKRIDVLFLEGLYPAHIRSDAQKLVNEHLHYAIDSNHIFYQDNHRHSVKLTNPERFEHESSVPSSETAVFAHLDNDEILMLVLNALSRSVGLSLDEIDPDVAFLNYGMDSIIGINFVADLNKVIGELLSPMDLYRYPAVTVLVDHIAKSCAPSEKPVEPIKKSAFQSEQDFADEMAHLSDAEIAALLEAELAELNLS